MVGSRASFARRAAHGLGAAALALAIGCNGAGSPHSPLATSAIRDVPPPSATPAPPPPAPPPPPATSPAPPPSPPPLAGKDFAAEAKLLFRVAACSGEEPLPAELDAPTVEQHCHALTPKIQAFRAYLERVSAFVAPLAPPERPRTVVYPFAGGDLATALAVYPDASEVTTVSLELAGDPRRLPTLSKAALERSLRELRLQLDELLATATFSNSDTLKFTQHGDIPGEIAFFLVGLAVHDFDPVHLRFFQLAPDGSAHYLTAEEIAAADGTVAERRKESWFPPDFSEAFANVEIAFRKRGRGEGAPVFVHRHLAANLGDAQLSQNGALLVHLSQKGPVSVLIKAASYLLWAPGFDLVRDYLAAHTAFGVSDSSGILPDLAARAGLTLEPYGAFSGTRIPASGVGLRAYLALFHREPHRPLPFRFGYLDTSGRSSLVVMRKSAP